MRLFQERPLVGVGARDWMDMVVLEPGCGILFHSGQTCDSLIMCGSREQNQEQAEIGG